MVEFFDNFVWLFFFFFHDILRENYVAEILHSICVGSISLFLVISGSIETVDSKSDLKGDESDDGQPDENSGEISNNDHIDASYNEGDKEGGENDIFGVVNGINPFLDFLIIDKLV